MERIAIRENELLNSGQRIANLENELSYSRERINNPLERILNPMERIAQFDITIYLCYLFENPHLPLGLS